MVYRAIHRADDPLNYFLQQSDEGPHLRVADIVVRASQDARKIFSRLIRIATNSHWSHSAFLNMKP
ncbi:MAG: hypothetical protein E6J36_04965 [Chloroflexi bacterium]|nr:MAG: hypothetical protein E6J36_04965 [Chloroflexota bacterium]